MQINKDSTVSIHYSLTVNNDDVVDSSFNHEPLDFIFGSGAVIPGLEKVLIGHKESDCFNVTIPAAEAYGYRDENLKQTIEKENFEIEDELQPGMHFQTEVEGGVRVYTVTHIDGNQVTIDGNHPLAGESLNFDVQVLKVRDATEQEKLTGLIDSNGL